MGSKNFEEVGFKWSNRVYRLLKRAGYNTVNDICLADECDLMMVRCLGRKALEEIKSFKEYIIKNKSF